MILVAAIVLWLIAVLEVWACCVVAGRADEQMQRWLDNARKKP